MALIEREPLALPAGTGTGVAVEPLGVFARPHTKTGWRSWVSTVDHKKIGIMYGVTAMIFFFVAGIEAMLIRIQLAQPNGNVLSADVYNQVYTMHGVTMVFLVVMPMAAAFANYLLPLQIGARDVAFPRLNALSFWIFLFGGLFLNSSWFIGGGGADCGWFCYAPNSGVTFSPTHGVDFYAIGLQIAGVASLIGSVNLIVTVLNMRAPGMTLFRMPVFTWMQLVVQFLLLFSLPVITVALFLLSFDRSFGANFFNIAQGADPLLWQHLFWIFGHPEVYILILPSFGIVSEIIPVMSRKPIYGYPFMVFSGIAIGFMGWGVWAHHMFASGLGPISVAAFSLSTMFIAVPTGVKILNWMATMWGGKITFNTPMLFSAGLVAMFTIGGLSGVTHSIAPADTQQTDTYYIVAHFHYVLFGGALLGLFAGIYFWFPKAFGLMLNEKLGKWHFWVMLVGFNLTFGPMHILGLQGMSRRIQTYQPTDGFTFWNRVATLGVFVIAIAIIVFLVNIAYSYSTWKKAGRPNPGPDPWDSRSLEWSIPSPTPEHNFDVVPEIHAQDDFWHRKYGEDERGRAVRIAATEDVVQKGDAKGVHLPSPSFYPLILAAGLPIIGYGVIFNRLIAIPGVVLFLFGIYGWAFEPATEPGDHGGDHGHHDDGGGDHDGAATTAPSTEGAHVG
jgi:cytochrome c oxidase subunit 1